MKIWLTCIGTKDNNHFTSTWKMYINYDTLGIRGNSPTLTCWELVKEVSKLETNVCPRRFWPPARKEKNSFALVFPIFLTTFAPISLLISCTYVVPTILLILYNLFFSLCIVIPYMLKQEQFFFFFCYVGLVFGELQFK